METKQERIVQRRFEYNESIKSFVNLLCEIYLRYFSIDDNARSDTFTSEKIIRFTSKGFKSSQKYQIRIDLDVIQNLKENPLKIGGFISSNADSIDIYDNKSKTPMEFSFENLDVTLEFNYSLSFNNDGAFSPRIPHTTDKSTPISNEDRVEYRLSFKNIYDRMMYRKELLSRAENDEPDPEIIAKPMEIFNYKIDSLPLEEFSNYPIGDIEEHPNGDIYPIDESYNVASRYFFPEVLGVEEEPTEPTTEQVRCIGSRCLPRWFTRRWFTRGGVIKKRKTKKNKPRKTKKNNK
jgi:hypothetical protein